VLLRDPRVSSVAEEISFDAAGLVVDMFGSLLAVTVKYGVDPEDIYKMACKNIKIHMLSAPDGDQLLTALAARALTDLAQRGGSDH